MTVMMTSRIDDNGDDADAKWAAAAAAAATATGRPRAARRTTRNGLRAARLADGRSVAAYKGASLEAAAAGGAAEVLRVPLQPDGGNGAADNGLAAGRALRPIQRHVVMRAVDAALVQEVAVVGEGLQALRTSARTGTAAAGP